MIIVAMTPTKVAVPGFLVHHVANIRQAKPIMSQKNGRWVIFQSIGEMMTLRIDHIAALIEIAAISRLVKYNNRKPSGIVDIHGMSVLLFPNLVIQHQY